MEHDLLAYLLHGLEPDEELAVEAYLEADANPRKDLRHWRTLLDPLNNLPVPEPPSTLYMNTLRAVAGHMVQARGPSFPARDDLHGSGSRWWRRADVMVAASVILVVGLLLPPLLMYMRHRQAVLACQDNLYHFHQAYTQYWEKHNGSLPNLADLPEDIRIAGMHPVLLREKQCWNSAIKLLCPGGTTEEVWQPQDRSEVRQMASEKQDTHWREKLGGQYAYPLGYLQGRELVGLRRNMGDEVPYLADRPPRDGVDVDWLIANSTNHGGKGQNVLFLGGHVRWLVHRKLSNDDDLFLNAHKKLSAGVHAQDIVLAPSEARPIPESAAD